MFWNVEMSAVRTHMCLAYSAVISPQLCLQHCSTVGVVREALAGARLVSFDILTDVKCVSAHAFKCSTKKLRPQTLCQDSLKKNEA